MRLRSAFAWFVVLVNVTGCARGTSPKKSDQARPASASAQASVGGIVYRSKNGTILTREQLQHASGEVNWEMPSPTPVPAEARAQHKKGREAGARGEHDNALRLFERAAKQAPEWPYPVYDAAFTYLLKGDADNALRFYKRTLELAPRGFFTAITAAHYLALEADGKLRKGTYLAFLSLEWIDSAIERSARTDALAAAVPAFAPIWKAKASLANDPKARLGMLDRGLEEDPNPDSETRGFLLINKALVQSELKRKDEAVAILGELAADQSQPLDVQQIALTSLSNVVTK